MERSRAKWAEQRKQHILRSEMALSEGRARKAQLQQIIAADAQFLAEQMMMDYSLLVGVLMPPEGGGTP